MSQVIALQNILVNFFILGVCATPMLIAVYVIPWAIKKVKEQDND